MKHTRSLRKLFGPTFLPWAAKGALAIADQGFFAGSNLLLNVFLARWLSAEDYGAFALAYSVFVLCSTLQTATFVEPMLVFGPGKYVERLDEYFGILVRGHFIMMLPLSLVMGISAVAIRHWSSASIGNTFFALALTTPLILLSWMLRRAFYIELQPLWAMFGGMLYLVVLMGLLFAANAVHRLSAVTALLLMGIASLAVSVFLLLRLRPCWTTKTEGIKISDVAISHWNYGRWSTGAAVVAWAPQNIYYIVLPAWFGLEGSAVLRAFMNLINPVLHVLIAFAPLLIPLLVRNRLSGGRVRMNRTMSISLAILLAGSGVFILFVWLFRSQVFHVLYGGKYQQFGFTPLLLLLLSLLVVCCMMVLSAGQMALEQPARNFWAYVAASMVTVLIGLPLAAWKGVEGAAEGFLLSMLTAAGFMYFFYRRVDSGRTVCEMDPASRRPDADRSTAALELGE